MTESRLIPYSGGMISLDPEMTFTGQDRDTGAPKEVTLQNRITVTYGKKKAVLNGPMVVAIAHAFELEVDLREWVEQCK